LKRGNSKLRRLFLITIVLSLAASALSAEDVAVYNDHGKRDPFWPLVNSSGNILSYETEFLISDLHLEGIVAGEKGKNLAVINNKVIEEKSQIGDFTVLNIGKNSVVLGKGDKTFELKLKKEE